MAATLLDAPYALQASKLKPLASCSLELSSSPPPAVVAICGSLNPIHNAHVKLFEVAKYTLESSHSYTVLGGFFSPVGDAYGKPGLKPAAQRVRIVVDAIRDHPDLSVDTWEASQATYTRTLYVLQQLERHVNEWYATAEPEAHARLAQSPYGRVRVILCCGADLFSSFWRPGCWRLSLLKQLLDSFPLVVTYREEQADVRTADDVRRLCQTTPFLRECVDGQTVEVDMRAYAFTFAQFAEPDDTSSTAVREVAAALARAEAEKEGGDVAARQSLHAKLVSMVPASAVDSVLATYGCT